MRAPPVIALSLGAALGLGIAFAVERARRRAPAPALDLGGRPAPEPEPDYLEEITVTVQRMAEPVLATVGPRGIRNRNPGNIRWIADERRRWRGMLRDDGSGYAVFDTAAHGVRALGKELLLDDKRGIRTVRGLISNWAPATENNTAAYIASVAAALNVGPDQPIAVAARLAELAAAIIRHENGMQPYAEADLRAWVYLP